MWGTTGAQPNTGNSKFGPDKTDNTTHNFSIGSSPVQLYFSPTDNTTNQIINAINSADHTLDIAMFTFINDDLGNAVVAAKNRGVTVRAIIENVSYFGSEYNNLLSNGINALSHAALANDFHHKYCIIDAMQGSSDPIVVTGSHNWTNSAEQDNDENTLIIHDMIIAQQYTEEFSKRFSESGGVGIEETNTQESVLIFPNPSTGNFTIKNIPPYTTIKIHDLSGKLCHSKENVNEAEVIHIELSSGFYFITIKTEEAVTTEKMIIE
jgi:phosphatidylserine/phosphatidylglycerophosphate/cardiolipin synthase-like enzyme